MKVWSLNFAVERKVIFKPAQYSKADEELSFSVTILIGFTSDAYLLAVNRKPMHFEFALEVSITGTCTVIIANRSCIPIAVRRKPTGACRH